MDPLMHAAPSGKVYALRQLGYFDKGAGLCLVTGTPYDTVLTLEAIAPAGALRVD